MQIMDSLYSLMLISRMELAIIAVCRLKWHIRKPFSRYAINCGRRAEQQDIVTVTGECIQPLERPHLVASPWRQGEAAGGQQNTHRYQSTGKELGDRAHDLLLLDPGQLGIDR